jgi:tetratricopeptide (TPR) repeat protein
MLAACAANPDDPAAPLMLEALARGLVPAGPSRLALPTLDLWLSRPISPADRAQALVWRGRVLEERQRLAAEAAEDYRKALDVAPDHAEARLRLARFLVRNQPAEALEHFRHLDRQTPGRPEVLLGLARTYHQLGDLDAADELLQRLQPGASNDPDVLVAAGALALDRGKPKDAEPLLRRAVSVAPRGRDPNVQLLRCLRELGDEQAVRKQQAVVQSIEDELQRQQIADRGKP